MAKGYLLDKLHVVNNSMPTVPANIANVVNGTARLLPPALLRLIRKSLSPGKSEWFHEREVLVITADGGAKFPSSESLDCGAGIVVMVHCGGIPIIIAEMDLPLFEAGNAQEAEAIANWVAV
eukprot:3022580-Heterocapsa_arctica.AAC.1